MNGLMKKTILPLLAVITAMLLSCTNNRVDIILDSNANAGPDDQFAIAYMLTLRDEVNLLAITTNATVDGGNAEEQATEARRIVRLMGSLGEGIPVIAGASANYEDIVPHINESSYDGCEVVQYIIDSARRHTPSHKLLLMPIGKITNIALALTKAPDIAPNVRVAWLGSNYPNPGGYNLVNDIPAVNAIIESGVDFTIAIEGSSEGMRGTYEVGLKRYEVAERVAGKGMRVEPVEGRNGGTFTCVGDYLLDLYDKLSDKHDNFYRSLYDVACIATTLHPEWAESCEIPAPIIEGNKWKQRPSNTHTIRLLYNFDDASIIGDFVKHLYTITPER